MLLPLFGKNKSNVTISWSSMIASAGAMLAPVVVKFAGATTTSFIIGAVIYVIVLVLTIIATMPSSLQKIRMSTQSMGSPRHYRGRIIYLFQQLLHKGSC